MQQQKCASFGNFDDFHDDFTKILEYLSTGLLTNMNSYELEVMTGNGLIIMKSGMNDHHFHRKRLYLLAQHISICHF